MEQTRKINPLIYYTKPTTLHGEKAMYEILNNTGIGYMKTKTLIVSFSLSLSYTHK